jgi:serine/threonine-protein kinase
MIGARFGNWVIVQEIGEGGMGRIFLAENRSSESEASAKQPRQAAVKVLPAALAQDTGFVERFEREIAALKELRHPNIVQFYQAGQHEGSYYYVMEYVDGASFADLLETAGRLQWKEVLELAIQVCPALKHAHDHGIIHRDLKPSNLLLRRDGVVKLLDFGVAKVFANAPITAAHAIIGTADYMSPEQAAGKNVTRRSDLYSLGVVMYHLVTGHTPFQADSIAAMMHKHRFAQFDSPKRFAADMPHDFDAVICQLLAKEPEQRPADAHVLGRELERLKAKYSRKAQATTDEVRPTHTVALTEDDTEQRMEGPGPATLMSRLMRAQLDEMNRPSALDRLFSRAWVVVPAFVLVIGLIVWGLWPKSSVEQVAEIRKLIAQQDWDDAAKKLDKLTAGGADTPAGTDLHALRQEIEEGQALQLARRNARGSGSQVTAASAAERFYREAVQDFNAGHHEAAIAKWRQLIAAFGGIERQRQWVLLAQDSLKKADETAHELTAIDEAIKLAEQESKQKAEARLTAMLELYRHLEPAKKRIEAALAKVREKN